MVFIAVHAGAGFHSSSKRNYYFESCKNACTTAYDSLLLGANAVAGITEAISYLEDDPIQNAGFGSNLNINGQVECDASLMDGKDLLFGAVGALTSIKNPIKAANFILNHQRIQMPLGLISPNFLVGDGAKKFALSKGLEEATLVSNYKRYKSLLDKENNERIDTVGAVCIDNNGYFAAGVSSGGIVLKKEGRIGQASIFGAGCWAQDGIALSTSGVGEYLVQTMLCRKMAESFLKNSDLNTIEHVVKIFNEDFFLSPMIKNVAIENRLVGIMGLRKDPLSEKIELFWGHSTKSMCIGYMNSNSTAKAFISELPVNITPGSDIISQSKIFKDK